MEEQLNPEPHPLSFWDERFRQAGFAYGEEPNVFFAEKLNALVPGIILLPAEGEGRNAVYAASKLWTVSAYDSSVTGKEKALQLARKKQVQIQYEIADHQHFHAPAAYFDCIALIYSHMPSAFRQQVHRKLLGYLKPGGTLILEAFSKEQLGRDSGGPQDPDWLYNTEILREDFLPLTQMEISETEIVLSEGKYHQGAAKVIRLTGIR